MIIQKMTQKRAKSYEITLDDQRTFIVSEDVLVKFRLLKGKEVDESLLAEIKKASAYDIGLQQALNYLSYQLRTEKEIAAYLKEKEIGAEDIQKICQYLKNQRLIDDVQYAKSYLQTALRLNDKGPTVIANKLKAKGIADNIIEEVLPLYTKEQQIEIAKKAAEKMLKRQSNQSHYQILQKCKLSLVQKGFSYAVVDEAMQQIEVEVDEEAEYAKLVKEAEKIIHRIKGKNEYEKKQKFKQKLYQKGFDLSLIQQYIDEEWLDE